MWVHEISLVSGLGAIASQSLVGEGMHSFAFVTKLTVHGHQTALNHAIDIRNALSGCKI